MREGKPNRTFVLDLFEKYVLLAIFCVFAYRMINNFLATGSPLVFIYLLDQLLVLGFILMRRAANDITNSGWEWFVGFAGTFLPMFVIPVSGSELAPQSVIFLFMLSGIALHLAAKLSLRRSMGVVAANRGVKMGGPYRFVRHPMYAGYVLVHTGLLLSWPSLFNLVILGATWCLFLLRIIAEERVLSEDPAYRQLKRRIPFRLIPGVY